MNKNEKIKLLADLVAIRSMNDNEEAVAEYLAAFLDKYGIESEIVQYAPHRANLVDTKTWLMLLVTGTLILFN